MLYAGGREMNGTGRDGYARLAAAARTPADYGTSGRTGRRMNRPSWMLDTMTVPLSKNG